MKGHKDIIENWVKFEDLVTLQACFDGKGVLPSSNQSISSIPNFLEAVIDGKNKLLKLGKERSLIVLGLDAISYKFAASILTPNKLIPLTSSFPSTSVTGWSSTMTGLNVEDHGLPGVVFFAPEISKIYNCLDEAIYINDKWIQNHPDKYKIEYGNLETIFNRLSSKCETIAIDGYFAYDVAKWSSSLIKGAIQTIKSSYDWSQITFDPNLMISSIIDDTNLALNSRNKDKNLFIWSLVNTDHYIHIHGYSDILAKAMVKLNNQILEWVENGHAVVIHSDHGQVQNYSDKDLENLWNDINSFSTCRHVSGGAGRTRWSYPNPLKETYLANQIEKKFGNKVKVIHKEELEKLGFLKLGKKLSSQLGELITIALGNEFPIVNSAGDYYSHDSVKYEHGSILVDEMIVPLAIYQPS